MRAAAQPGATTLEPPPRRRVGPAGVLRSGARVTRASLFMANMLAGLARVPLRLPEDLEQSARMMRWASQNICSLHGIEVVLEGQVPAGPAVLVSNHVSYVDPVAILSQAPAGVVAKQELGTWPVIGSAVRGLGVLLVDRRCAHSGAHVLLQARQMLAAGGSVLAFPEGTTTLGERLLPFRRGFFGMARIMSAPVVPVALRYESADACWARGQAFLPHYLRSAARPHTRVHMRVDAPIEPHSVDSASALADATRRRILAMLALQE
ncbi:MAG: lysophospholipid acyltransferase family protein [Myxococcota bacterium]